MALDSRCGENDGGPLKGPVVITPLDSDDIRPATVDLQVDRKILVFTYLRPAAAERLCLSPGLGSKYQGRTEPTAGRFYRDFPCASGNNQ